MDELDLIRDRAETVGFAPAEHLAPARERLLAAARGERRHRSRRWVWLGGASVGLAAAITAVVTLAPADQVGVGPAVAHADPVKVLTAAADTALKDPGKPPRPDQFLYVKTEYTIPPNREVWLSVDGTRDSLIGSAKEGGCRNGKAPMYGTNDPRAEGTLQDCTPKTIYRTDLPTTADAMLAYLYGKEADRAGRAGYIGKAVYTLAYEQVLQPASYAALFEAAAKVPGLTALDHVTDGAGRPGVGIEFPVSSGSSPKAQPIVLVFDATTYQFLGTTDSAVTVKTYVDAVGQRP
ncbi:CU044_5270 family protein [Amycolatopsis sp. Hca4]|uniref:CU044_5270 family protein n=1 Tax=Amycolatopsis sp. Hca4 TaxID=2742131 RepID=UPI0015909FC8|nr:CU044_5270 family protein [Amycolatopsis sp. Hca4]QKV73309.1 CU044_5270 family protein [Amycolatopsis sp. Hca4]